LVFWQGKASSFFLPFLVFVSEKLLPKKHLQIWITY